MGISDWNKLLIALDRIANALELKNLQSPVCESEHISGVSFKETANKVYKEYVGELTAEETASLRKLEQEWEGDKDDALKPSNRKDCLDIEAEEIFMDLTEVTVEAQTPAALLVTKKGKQKWVPKSLIINPFDYEDIKKGKYIEAIRLTPKGEHWFHNKKAWEDYRVL